MNRTRERQLLLDRMDEALKGKGSVVAISGEAGMGKSRLAMETIREATRANMIRLVLQTSAQNTGTPFFAIIKNIEYSSDILPGDTVEEREAKISELFERFMQLTDLQRALIYHLLGVNDARRADLEGFAPREIRARTLEVLQTVLQALIKRGAIIVVEDLQWIDPSTKELLAHVLPAVEKSPSLALLTMRGAPDMSVFAGLKDFAEYPLGRLDPSDMRTLVTNIVPEHQITPGVLETMVARSDGVPIFAEELAYAMRERAEQKKAVKLTDRSSEDDVPSTLTESLLARLDLLSHGQEVVQYAAAIGTDVQIEFLKKIAPLPDEVIMAGIDELVAARILLRDVSRAGDTVIFRQTLVRDCAYGMVLKRNKVSIHAKIAEVTEKEFPQIMKVRLDFVPRHLELSDQTSAAIHAWRQAGNEANAAAAVSEAVAHFNRALELCLAQPASKERDELELSIRTEIAFPMIALESYNSSNVIEHIERATELAKEASANHRMLPLLMVKWLMTLVSSSLSEGANIAKQITQAAKDGAEVEQLLLARVLSTQALFEGRLDEATKYLNAFKETYDAELHDQELMKRGATNHSVTIDLGFASAFALMDRSEEAQHYSDLAIQGARDSQHINTICQTLVGAVGFCAALERDSDALHQSGEELTSIMSTFDMSMWRHHANLFCGLASFHRGDQVEGLKRAKKGIKGIAQTGSIAVTAWFVFYAEIACAAGETDEARWALDLAMPSLEGGEKWFEAEIIRLRAIIDLKTGAAPQEVAEQLEKALSCAEAQSAHLIAQRAKADLENLSAAAVAT